MEVTLLNLEVLGFIPGLLAHQLAHLLAVSFTDALADPLSHMLTDSLACLRADCSSAC